MPYKNPEDTLRNRKEYYLKNRERILARNKTWVMENREKVNATKREYNKKISKDKKEEYNAKARERYRRNIDWNTERKKIYKSNNKHIVNASSSKRRAEQLKRIPVWLTDFDKLKIKCIYSIAAMLTRENKEPWVVDHIIPLQGKIVSGLHVPSNLQVMRARENESKSNKFEVL